MVDQRASTHPDSMIERKEFYIDGRWIDASANRTLVVSNPANGAELARIALASSSDVDVAVSAARQRF